MKIGLFFATTKYNFLYTDNIDDTDNHRFLSICGYPCANKSLFRPCGAKKNKQNIHNDKM
jgi:hypothetical protein